MKALLDTNIVIHREASKVINKDIGQLFFWLDKTKHEKFIHPLTVDEINKYKDNNTVETMNIKLDSYNILKTIAPFDEPIKSISEKIDKTPNDIEDSKLLSEVIHDRVDILITEDKKIHSKAFLAGISDRVYNIESFLEKTFAENPSLIDYNVLSVKQQLFGKVKLADNFFDSFREDYPGFDKWFNGKSNEPSYTCYYGDEIGAFLYIKKEDETENYSNISPPFLPKKRLKIGTLKVSLNGLKIGERLLKIVFDNALKQKAEEIYVTIFNKRPEQVRLIELLESFGFKYYGIKTTSAGEEKVYVRDFKPKFNKENPRNTYPYFSKKTTIWFVSIFPEYHTELFPDSILKTESPIDFVENEPHRNAISKVYVSHSKERNIKKGDTIVFYRTGGLYKGVVTTIGIAESAFNPLNDFSHLVQLCKNKSVLTETKLKEFWDRYGNYKPFVVNFLYAYSLPKRPNLAKLIELDIITGPDQMPRGFSKLTENDLVKILKASESNESIVVD
jgi:predicted nucleic acid-binding protein